MVYINESDITKPKKWREPTEKEKRKQQEEKRKHAEAEDRKMFLEFAAKHGVEVS